MFLLRRLRGAELIREHRLAWLVLIRFQATHAHLEALLKLLKMMRGLLETLLKCSRVSLRNVRLGGARMQGS